jgi:hypothetical protein
MTQDHWYTVVKSPLLGMRTYYDVVQVGKDSIEVDCKGMWYRTINS